MQKAVNVSLKGIKFRKWAKGQNKYELEKEIEPRCYCDPAIYVYEYKAIFKLNKYLYKFTFVTSKHKKVQVGSDQEKHNQKKIPTPKTEAGKNRLLKYYNVYINHDPVITGNEQQD